MNNLASHDKEPRSFSDFYNSLISVKFDQFRANKDVKVVDETAFSEMREYLIEHYKGIEVLHSFVDYGDSIFDCIPVEQQPSIKKSGQKVLDAPDFPSDITTVSSEKNAKNDKAFSIKAPLSEDYKDRFGNTMFCPPGTIPIRRITIKDLTRFKTLKNYFRKSPLDFSSNVNTTAKTDEIQLGDTASHKHAVGRQNVRNFGGHSTLLINQPPINSKEDQIFSLSQQWYGAGSEDNTQTVEVGWQVNPGRFRTILPVLFIYWTADNYKKTGCYNLDCTAFVQTNNRWTLGGALKPLPGGAPTEIGLSFHAVPGGVWWLYITDMSVDQEVAIGYYPNSIFKGGPLSSFATRITFGGETVGKTSWPPMGTGYFGTGEKDRSPPPKASYHRQISYFDGSDSQPANLNVINPSPKCYDSMTANIVDWGKTLYYGGPGGTDCKSQ